MGGHQRKRRGLLGLVLLVASVIVATAATTNASPAPVPSPLSVPVAPAPTAATGTSTLGLRGWEVLSSADSPASGRQISGPAFDTRGWLAVRPDDAGAPGTEIEAVLQNGACPDVFYATNMKKCFGYEKRIGADTVARFAVPWWFRTNFTAPLGAGRYQVLIVPGVVGQADVWVNGTEVATEETVQGDDTRYTFPVTGLLKSG
ncbi:MAG TPA: hypothetical protein VIJ09_06320, partial [Acidimicrobiales bacterium]